MLRILTVVFDLEKGGTQRAAQNFAMAYSEIGHDSRILGYFSGGTREHDLNVAGIHTWKIADACLHEIKSWSPDVVHLHSHNLEADQIRKFISQFGDPIVVDTNVFSQPWGIEDLLHCSFQLSSWAQYLYIARGGPADKSAILPNPVDTDAFYRVNKSAISNFKLANGIPTENLLIGRVGQHYNGKWAAGLLDVFNEFVHHTKIPATLLLCNPPPAIRDYISQHTYSEGQIVIIDQIIGDDNLRTCYSAIDIFLHIADIGESFGMVLCEAMLCESVVVTLNTPWADNSQGEVISYNQFGYTANTKTEITSALLTLTANSDSKQKKKLGRKFVIDNYNSLVVAKRAIDLITTKPSATIANTNLPPPPLNHIQSTIARLLILLGIHSKFLAVKKTTRFFLRLMAGI